MVIKELDLIIPVNQTTAIVGASGSGKTTLMKLLMKFYEPNDGKIKLGNLDFKNISQKAWRAHCGVVMQEGYIFNDTMANNIAIGDNYVDKEKLRKAVEIGNLCKMFMIKSLPRSLSMRKN